MVSQRLDMALVSQGLAPTRARAQSLIQEGLVEIDGEPARKPSQKVSDSALLTLSSDEKQWVGRGALKLIKALDHFHIDPKGKVAADIGASTGGFCEVLLERDVQKIYAVDVGHDQLHPTIMSDPRVINMEGVNAKTLSADVIPEPLDLIVSDVSFISLEKALPAALSLCKSGAYLAALIKPQFEVGRENIAKGGIVKNPEIAAAAAKRIEDWINGLEGWSSLGVTPSPIKGGDGNTEFLIGARYER
ncbi:TlyA family rRNA (cytidine-2'-O)-methyltransferase [Sneathiella sp. P13V-1]|uniref:TlyA family RNA methyltransferase n=1 Tax=Sneathiella sp. P13V-1 TaxID=2697366 RepID=UPI00187B3121|nr:TlyA family RNA methyltransferase [Sneathiella sp. P13V-1]MBE7637938.1 TlyA family rRNA (cytidine-2'-O)-methyltransferase [Sneathiella sp. P13V-1]